MKEFIDKLIEKIVNTPTKCLDTYSISCPDVITAIKNGIEYGCASRQHEIIDIVNELSEEYKDKSNDAWKEIYDKVCNLEKQYANNGNMEIVNDCIRLENLLQYFKEELQTEEYNNGWIPCSERLPEEGKTVLTCDRGGWISVNVNSTYAGKKNDFECGYYVAWMPLPVPYTKGE